jgi:hypothetical protein
MELACFSTLYLLCLPITSQRRNKLRKKSMIPTFNVSTQTVDNGSFNNKSALSGSSRLEKFRKESQLAEQFQYHARPHALSQPFLGFIRKHEKIYAREIGLMRIALREFKGLYDHLKLRLDTALSAASTETLAPDMLHALQQIQLAFNDGSWVFDPRFFIRKVQMNPLEDPMDVAAQANIISSYEEAAQQTAAQIEAAQRINDPHTAAQLKEVQTELQNLLTDLNLRAREKGGWRALLYTSKGEVDMNMSLTPWKPEEQVQILLEKLRSAQQKAAEAEKTHEIVVRQLHETIEQAHARHRPALHANKPRAHSHITHGTPPAAAHTTGARSMSLSGPATHIKPLDFRAHPNQHDGATHDKPHAVAAHRHTLAHVGGAHPPLPTHPVASAVVGIAAEMHDSAELSHPHSRSTSHPHSADPSPRVAEHAEHHETGSHASKSTHSEGVARRGSKVTAVPQPGADGSLLVGDMGTVLHTLQSLHASLESARHQQEQQQDHIRHLHAVIRAQNEQLEARALSGAGTDREVLRGSVDGESSLLSQPSQDIIDEYQQIGSPPSSPVDNPRRKPSAHGAAAGRSPGVPSAVKSLMPLPATGPRGATGGADSGAQRRGSMLVQHRGNTLEFVPVGKVGATHNLRITVNNELRDHKHLLLRPTSANTFSAGAPKSFASILASSPTSGRFAPGSKAPQNKISQLEAQKRREQALHVMHHGKPVPPIMSGGLMPHNNSNANTPTAASGVKMDTSDVAAMVPHVQPPSPKGHPQKSATAMVQELSAIMDDEVTSTHPNTQRSLGASDGEKTPGVESAPHATADNGPQTTEDALKAIHTLCEKLQDALVMQSAALKAGQELLAGVDGKIHMVSSHSADDVGDTDLLGLQIGESAIDHDHSEDHRPHPRRNSPTSRDMPHSPQRLGGKNILQRTRPKTAGDMSSSQDSYEGLFIDVLGDSTAAGKHSDVGLYATTLQNRYLHHLQEAKRLETAMLRLGKASDQDDIKHQQDVAQAHYASLSLFRPQSAAASLTGQVAHHGAQSPHKSSVPGLRAHSASATHSAAAALRRESHHANHTKQRGVTAVPFAKVAGGGSVCGEGGLNADSVYSPRLHEHSAELSNLSEHEL